MFQQMQSAHDERDHWYHLTDQTQNKHYLGKHTGKDKHTAQHFQTLSGVFVAESFSGQWRSLLIPDA